MRILRNTLRTIGKITPVIVFLVASPALHAQMLVQEVLSMTSLIQAIDTLYATYDHINATIETVKNTYAQLEQAAKAMQNINFDDVGALSEISNINSWEDFGDYRHNISSAVANINANMNYMNNLTDVVTKNAITIGPYKFTMASMMGFGKEGEMSILGLPKAIWEYTKEQGAGAVAGWTGNLTAEQRQAIALKYGMSPRNYAQIVMAEKMLEEVSGKMFGYGTEPVIEEVLGRVARNNQAILEELNLAGAEESTVALAKAGTEATLGLREDLSLLIADIKRIMDFAARKYNVEQVTADAAAEAKKEDEERKQTFSINPSAFNPRYGNPEDL